MPIRTLALIALFAASPLYAADSDSPLAQDRGKARPLLIYSKSGGEQALVDEDKAVQDPGLKQRDVVIYKVVGLSGERNGKPLETQATMALIRELNLGAGTRAKVVLVGKDGEKKLESTDPLKVEQIFSTIDQMPMAEKQAAAAAAPAAEAPADNPKANKGKATKAAAAKPPTDLED
ncbi:DUF4174 domain-containing protein [Pseudomonas sp. RIT-PI-S]|uniref:DUF4174 domain-containing protein n=1 Tax=Pseudomonas sp. RIT-PI-S TaxID=3035295 RepID=UPI0021D8D7ED|nr:DUF4174 domain-containing protein [Pseudomonas sp. RIT-PI-S]